METVEICDLDKLENAPSARYGHSTVIVGNRLYLFGGCSPDGKEFYKDLHVLNLGSMGWEESITPGDEIVGRHFHTCTPTSGETARLIFFGGKSNGYKNDVFVFDLSTKEFIVIPPKFRDNEKISSCRNDDVRPPSPRYGHSATFISEKVFIFGGYDSNGFTKNDLYCFDFITNMWKKFVIAQIPYRYHHSGVLIGSNYFILGGITKSYTPLSDVYRLDLTNVSEMMDDHGVEAFKLTIENPIASYGHKCFVLENRIYQYGGRDNTREFRHLLRLESGKGNLRWEAEKNIEVDDSKILMSYGSLDLYDGKLLFFGGQFRGEKKIQEEEEEELDEELEDSELDDLPYDCIFQIFNFLDEIDIIYLGSVSKNWNFSICARSDRMWEKKYKEACEVTKLGKFRMKKVLREDTSFLKFKRLRDQEYIQDQERKKAAAMGYTENLKLFVVGDGAVGKTCLLMSLANNSFPEDYVPSVFDNYNVNVFWEDKCVSLNLWDSAGEEDYDRIRRIGYPETNVFLICFSLVDPSSYDNVRSKWKPELDEHAPEVPFVLCGTKLDLRDDSSEIKSLKERDEKPITREQGEKLSKEIKAVCYHETSAKTQLGVHQCFQDCISIVLEAELGDHEKKGKKGGGGGCGIM